jgi:sugar lactone lactonase YvrE
LLAIAPEFALAFGCGVSRPEAPAAAGASGGLTGPAGASADPGVLGGGGEGESGAPTLSAGAGPSAGSGNTPQGGVSAGGSHAGGESGGGAGAGVTQPGTEPPLGPGPYAGMKPVAGTPLPLGSTRIFDDLAGLVWSQPKQELLLVVGQNNKIMRWRDGLSDEDNFDVVRPGAEMLDEMKGLDIGPDGALWVCEPRYAMPHRVSRSSAGYDHPLTVVDHWQGSAAVPASDFTSPWYISVRWDGNAYFTDTPHTYSGKPNKSVFRIDPAGNLTMLKHYATDADLSEGGAFGIALSPNQRALYIDTWNHPGYPQLVRFDLDASGGVAKETLIMTDEAGPIQSVDGLCLDQAENIYLCAGGGGVRMYSPSGEFFGTIDVPGATDCSFGGSDMKSLFVGTSGGVAGDKNLYRVPLNIPGLP